MIIKAKGKPGFRDDVLEDAYSVSCKTGAQIQFDFNDGNCVVTGSPRGWGSAVFQYPNGKMEIYNRIFRVVREGTLSHSLPTWTKEEPGTANASRTAEPATPEAKQV